MYVDVRVLCDDRLCVRHAGTNMSELWFDCSFQIVARGWISNMAVTEWCCAECLHVKFHKYHIYIIINMCINSLSMVVGVGCGGGCCGGDSGKHSRTIFV